MSNVMQATKMPTDFQEINSSRPWSQSLFTGSWTPAGEVLPITAPGLPDENLGTAGIATPEDVSQAAETAASVQPAWAAVPSHQRAEIMRKVAALLLEATPAFEWWIRRETGSSAVKAQFEIKGTAADFNDAAAIASEPSGQLLSAAGEIPQSMARRRPLGVVGIITPWNSPLLLAARVVAPALALGNAVILKPDPQTPVSGGALLAQILQEAGVPAGVFQVLPGGADVGQALVSHDLIAKVSFTGSTQAGRHVGRVAGELLKPVSLELGGNNALIIREDANIDKAVEAAGFGTFFHQGQICFTPGRHLVHVDVADEYIEKLVRRASGLVVGPTTSNSTHVGPIINEHQLASVHEIVTATVAQGAHLAQGGVHDGLYYQPTVLTEVTPDMPAFRREIFGPVAPITVFTDDDEAIRLANDTEYGLATGILSGNLSRALDIADRVDTGIVHINDQTVVRGGGAPIGGNRASGNGGRAGRVVNLDEWTSWQWLTTRPEIAPQPF